MTNEFDGSKNLRLVRALAQGILSGGAFGSLAFTLQAERNNHSMILLLLFAAWVLSPFVALIFSGVIDQKWRFQSRVILYVLMMAISFVSLLFYGGWFSFKGVKPAFVFLFIPSISWVIILLVYAYFRPAKITGEN
jgi:FlaA1/EpsC-like NDP-sugar epimerase